MKSKRELARKLVYARIAELNELEGRAQGFVFGERNYYFILSRFDDEIDTAHTFHTQIMDPERLASEATIKTVISELGPEILTMLGRGKE